MKPKEIIEQSEAEAVERISTALMDFYRATGLRPWRVEIVPVFGDSELEGYNITLRSNRHGV